MDFQRATDSELMAAYRELKVKVIEFEQQGSKTPAGGEVPFSAWAMYGRNIMWVYESELKQRGVSVG